MFRKFQYYLVACLTVSLLLTNQFRSAHAQNSDADPAVGTWDWKWKHIPSVRDGRTGSAELTVKADGTFRMGGSGGKWKKSGNRYLLDWGNGKGDVMILSRVSSGWELNGRNHETDWIKGTRPADPSPPAKRGLVLEASRLTVNAGDTFSVPAYLRYRGTGSPPKIGNANFEVSYDPTVVQVLPHPNPARKPNWTTTEQEPELPRGNLLPGGTLIAGNARNRGIVRVGFAGKQGAAPGSGRAGETVTEIYFKAVGKPGDKTDLTLKITTANDADGRDIEIIPVHGRVTISIPGDPSNGGGIVGGRGRGGVTALDASRALLMSVDRLEPLPQYYDVDRDRRVTSNDSRKILQEALSVLITP